MRIVHHLTVNTFPILFDEYSDVQEGLGLNLVAKRTAGHFMINIAQTGFRFNGPVKWSIV